MDSRARQKVALTFALYQGDQLVRRETVAQDIVKVGKDPRRAICASTTSSPRACTRSSRWRRPTDITLIDLGNEPGTMVNGARVNKCKIRPGDQIQIGSTQDRARERRAGDGRAAAGGGGCVRGAPAQRRSAVRAPAAAAAAASNPFAGRIRSRRRPPPARTRSRGANPFAPAAPSAAIPFALPSTPFVAQAAAAVGTARWPRHRRRPRALRLHLLDGQERPRRAPRRGRGRARSPPSR